MLLKERERDRDKKGIAASTGCDLKNIPKNHKIMTPCIFQSVEFNNGNLMCIILSLFPYFVFCCVCIHCTSYNDIILSKCANWRTSRLIPQSKEI